ncbi:hypothetical protein ACFYZE_28330 [Streptomyces sp. NPDC001796]|uniref:hypothetical protein n=1 Tax=Streptomyces sp. NPDC001796 TaxID=3364609 RepID=UPI0036AD336D
MIADLERPFEEESTPACRRGLIAPLERKNGSTRAEQADHCGPDRINRQAPGSALPTATLRHVLGGR